MKPRRLLAPSSSFRPDKVAFCSRPRDPQSAIYSWTLEDDLLVLKAERRQLRRPRLRS
jgi:hypothetical protein